MDRKRLVGEIPVQRRIEPRKALAAIAVGGALVAGGGYLTGHAGGANRDAAVSAGESAGARAGEAAGYRQGYASGLGEGEVAGYRLGHGDVPRSAAAAGVTR